MAHRKIMSMCLAGIMVISMMLSACGTQNTESSDVTTAPVETTEAPVETTADATEPSAAETTVPETTTETETVETTESVTESSEATETSKDDSNASSEDGSKDTSDVEPSETVKPAEFDSSDYETVDETVYANTYVNIRKGPSTDYEKVGSLSYGESIHRTGIGDAGWSRVEYNGEVCYMFSDYIQRDEPAEPYDGNYPLSYSDGGVSITITKEWYGESNVYAAHVILSDYSRFRGEYLGGQYLSSAAAGKVLGINGDWASPNGYTEIRGGNVICEWNVPEGAYYADTGVLWYAQANGYSGASETFCFGPAFLIDGSITCGGGGGGAQRTFIGTNGTPGDLWLVVSDGRGLGGSAGLTAYECAAYLQSKGCTFGVPLDGGGSTEMVFQGHILNVVNGERALNDALYITY